MRSAGQACRRFGVFGREVPGLAATLSGLESGGTVERANGHLVLDPTCRRQRGLIVIRRTLGQFLTNGHKMSATSRKEREKERKRAQILEAAEVVFRRKGYQATTMDEVAEEAEFSKGALYLYFGSKFALFTELSNQVLTRVLDEFKNISNEPLNGRDLIAKMLRLWASEMSSNIRRFRLAISWVASDDDHDRECPGMHSHRETMGSIIGVLAATIVCGQKDGSIQHAGAPATLACQLWSGMVGALLFSSRIKENGDKFPAPIDSESFMDDFVDFLSLGLAATSVA